MQPVLVIVGCPNVGKSTLFNRLTRSRDALVANLPGVTRDRIYGQGEVGGKAYTVVDTGGMSDERAGLASMVAAQVRQAVEEADSILFLVDARAGLTAADQAIGDWLRALGKPVQVAANKVDGLDPESAAAEFHALGLGAPVPISAAHGRGISRLMAQVLTHLTPEPQSPATEDTKLTEGGVQIAVIGRPNVGKSTLVNRLLGEERMLVSDIAGTTRDSIHIPFARAGRMHILVDTAGIRRRGQIAEVVEKFSVIKALRAIQAADVAILLVDAHDGIAEQDLRLLGFALEAGRAIVIGLNKWDGLPSEQRVRVRQELARRLVFAEFVPVHYISALHGSGVGELFRTVLSVYEAASHRPPTARINSVLREAAAAHAPPLVGGRRIKLRYAHLGGLNPPLVVVHGNQTESVPDSYRRYLAGAFRKAFGWLGTPVQVEFKTGENPYKDRRNTLTPRQIRHRERLRRHTGRR